MPIAEAATLAMSANKRHQGKGRGEAPGELSSSEQPRKLTSAQCRPTLYDAPLEEGGAIVRRGRGKRRLGRGWSLHGEATSITVAYGKLELGEPLVREMGGTAGDFNPPTDNQSTDHEQPMELSSTQCRDFGGLPPTMHPWKKGM